MRRSSLGSRSEHRHPTSPKLGSTGPAGRSAGLVPGGHRFPTSTTSVGSDPGLVTVKTYRAIHSSPLARSRSHLHASSRSLPSRSSGTWLVRPAPTLAASFPAANQSGSARKAARESMIVAASEVMVTGSPLVKGSAAGREDARQPPVSFRDFYQPVGS